jgi:hypothetical protein
MFTTITLWSTNFTFSNTGIEETVVTFTWRLRSVRVFWTSGTVTGVLRTVSTPVITLFTVSIIIVMVWTVTNWGVDSDSNTDSTVINRGFTSSTLWGTRWARGGILF